jgi:carboxymethylenebutenolidase
MGQFMNLTAADGFVCPAYEALPPGPRKGGLVLLQEIFGLNSHIRAVADAYADDGYHVIAPATFHRVKADVDLGYAEADIEVGRSLKAAVEALPAPGVQADVQAAIDHLGREGRVAVMGYCWGGLLSWRAACALQGLAAAVCYYGGGMTVGADAARQPRVPVLAHFGSQDHAIPLVTVEAFERAQTGVEVQIYTAQHGFNCDHRGSFDFEAALLARERSLAFLARHLG